MGKMKWPESRQKEDFDRILSPDGKVIGNVPDIEDDELLRWHEAMVKTRMFEEMGVKFQRRGVFSVAGGGPGEEAIGLGAAAALEAGDWLHPSYRQNASLIYWNVPIDRTFGAMLGHAPEHVKAYLPLDPADVPKVKTTPYAVFLGAHIPVATGTALADKLGKRSHVSLAFIGDGATSVGDFHDGLGLAGVLKVPLVVVIANNGWSISIPASRQTAAETFAQKAVAHGIPHCRVDGNDVFAVYAATKAAVEAARAGEGPYVIEAVSYRMTSHNTADQADIYREQTEFDYWAKRDPIDRFEIYLASRNLIDDAYKQAQRGRIDVELRKALERALEVPVTPAETMFLSHLHGEQGWHVRHQQEELAAEIAGNNPFVDFDGAGFGGENGRG